MRQLVGLIDNKVIGPESITTNTRPALVSDGIDVTSWHEAGSMTYPQFEVFLDGSAAASLTAPSAGTLGVELWGYKASRSAWYFIQSLNKGTAIPIIGAGQGYAEQVNDVGDFDRLAVACTISAGTLTASFGPLETWTY